MTRAWPWTCSAAPRASSRPAGRAVTANSDLLLAQLSDVPDAQRGARFVCAAALVGPDGVEHVERGEMTGVLLRERRGEGGFGYDPLFLPDGEELTSAELTAEAKDA